MSNTPAASEAVRVRQEPQRLSDQLPFVSCQGRLPMPTWPCFAALTLVTGSLSSHLRPPGADWPGAEAEGLETNQHCLQTWHASPAHV